MRFTTITKSFLPGFSMFLALSAAAPLLRADAPATQPAADAQKDSPEVKVIRDIILDADKNDAKRTLEQVRKEYHTENEKEATFIDFIAHESWEESKAQQAVRDKWGPEAEGKFAHMLAASTLEDDQVCTIKIDGDHATISWDNIKGSSPMSMVKVDGHWLADGHAMYAEATKDDPTKAPVQNPSGPMMKQVVDDIAAGKFDDADAFLADFKTKVSPPDGN